MPLLAAVTVGCQSTLADLESLATQDPLPYSVLVTGGTFEQRAVDLDDEPPSSESPHEAGLEAEEANPLNHTFARPGQDTEAIPLQDFIQVLEAGRVFVRVDPDSADAELRRRIAALSGPVPPDDEPLQALLAAARRDGHDLLLVVQTLQDGAVEEQGINGSWPITLSVWLLLGLGMFIPDHTFQSRANLRISLREVQTGRVLYDTVRDSGPVDLALVERGSVWGVLGSIIIPPFWVPNDDQVAVDSVRQVSARRLLVAVARQLKAVEAQQELDDRSAARIDLAAADGMLDVSVEVRAPESLAVVRVRVDSQPLEGQAFERFQSALLSSVQRDGNVLRYRARLPLPSAGEYLQILVQTTAGRRASETLSLSEGS